MPIRLPVGVRQPGEHEFAQVAYEVMNVAFAVHNEMGGLFDELIYQRAIAARIPGARLEVPIEISFDTFSKVYYIDLLVADCAPFELNPVGKHQPEARDL